MELSSSHDWVAKALVMVKYPKDDVIGMFFGYYSLLVYQIQAVYMTLFLRNRDILTFLCCFTHLLSEIMNYILKHILKHPRPEHGAPDGGLFEGRYGMPSQHCHCFSYLVTMVFLLVFHYYRSHIQRSKKILVSIIFSVALILQVVGRVYLRFHTINQCIAGVVVGSFSATIFYVIGLNCFMPYANTICKLPLMRFFSFRKDLITPPPSSRLHHKTSYSDAKNERLHLKKN